jgi:hypothetical protein
VIGVSFNSIEIQGEKFMAAALIEQISNLSDADSVSFLQHFDQVLVNGVTNDFDELLANIPHSIRELPQFNSIEGLAFGETKRQLTEQESIKLAKQILVILGQNSDFLPLLEQAWENWKPNYDKGSTPANLLSAALAASMIIIVATSQVKGNIGGVEFSKPITPIGDVTALVGQFVKIIYGSPAK